ncbi:MAG: hypothetical protein NTV34_03705 [Proteobacteria bacterium]|nr:hypothetical protein [Pseudomonadota bacterium]
MGRNSLRLHSLKEVHLSLQFHHFFVFVSRDAPVVDHLQQSGFLEGSRNTHPGQGTENRRIFFQNGMLEFIWVNNLPDIKSPTTVPTRLVERSQYQDSDFSPFGICLCPPSETITPVEQPFQGRPYYPKYLPPGYAIWEADNDARPSMALRLLKRNPSCIRMGQTK